MNENSHINTKVHNTVVGILTMASIGAIIESITQGWEYWVPPLILVGLIAAWIMHILQYRQKKFRENYFLVFAMIISFYHGAHDTSLFDIVLISLLIMATVSLLRRAEFLNLLLIEFFVLFIMQVVRGVATGMFAPDTVTISRIVLHIAVEICGFMVFREVVGNNTRDAEELDRSNAKRLSDKADMENLLTNISGDLRVSVDDINSQMMKVMKDKPEDDIAPIADAGFRMATQIESIQDYSDILRGDVTPDENEYMISSIIKDIIAGYSFYQKESSKDLIVDLDPNVPSVLKGDAGIINKILGHILFNAFKFTEEGGVYLRVTAVDHENTTNLVIEVTDTGVGMSAEEIEKISTGTYQSKIADRSNNGGIGLGLPIVYGFVRSMNGFVSIESEKGKGTTVRVSIMQEVVDPSPTLRLSTDSFFNVVFHLDPQKYKESRVWEFYRDMAVNMASKLRINMYFAPTQKDVEKLMERGDITHIFMGEKEYLDDPEFYERLSEKVTVAVSTSSHDAKNKGHIIFMPRPLYGYPIISVLSGEGGRV